MTKTTDELRDKLAQRYRHKRELGVPAGNRGSSEQTDIESGLAEKFAADSLGCEFNSDVLDGNDGGYDFIFNEKKVDVKWMGFYSFDKSKPRDSGRIIVDLHKIGGADIYIAVAGSEKTKYKCLGWCTMQDLKNRPLWKSNFPDDNGKYERYAIHTDDLRPMNILYEDIKK